MYQNPRLLRFIPKYQFTFWFLSITRILWSCLCTNSWDSQLFSQIMTMTGSGIGHITDGKSVCGQKHNNSTIMDEDKSCPWFFVRKVKKKVYININFNAVFWDNLRVLHYFGKNNQCINKIIYNKCMIISWFFFYL